MNVRTGLTSAASVLAIGLALTGCSAATEKVSTTTTSSGEVAGASAPASIQDQLKVIEVALVSQQKANEAGLTETSSGYAYAFDPAVNRSVRYYEESNGEPVVWEEGNRSSVLSQMMNFALSGVSDVVKSDDSMTFTTTNPYGEGKYTFTLALKDGLITSISEGDEFSSNKTVLEYSVTDAAKAAFAVAVSPEEAYSEQIVEEPAQ